MKRRLFTFALAALTIGLLGSCSKINERIDGLDNRVYDLENEKIVSIEQQIATINQSIADLETIRTNIQNLKNEQEAQGQDITDLQAKDQALEGKINDLRTYVDTELSKYATTEWANATFATLEQLNTTNTELGALKETVGKLGEAFDGKLSDLKTELTKSINTAVSNLESRISTLEARVSALEKMIQTVSIIPAYNNGSVKAEDGILTINCVITPKEAVESLKKENFTILTSESEVLTKNALYGTLTIAKDEDLVLDKTNGTATIKVDVSSVLPTEEDKALTVAVNVKNGISDFTTEFVPVTVAAAKPTVEYVEIGGLKWATKNLGAEKVTDYGDYFAWGETAPYYEGTGGWPATPTWKSGKESGYTWQSYCGSSSFSEWSTPPYDATTKILKPEFDAAAQILGDGWRMPTIEEFQALYDACGGSYDTKTNPSGASASVGKGVYWCTSYDGVKGCLFCDGTNKLFFPAAGFGNDASLSSKGSLGYFWSSSLGTDDTGIAYDVTLGSVAFNAQDTGKRYRGFPVRPVKAAAPAPTPTTTGTAKATIGGKDVDVKWVQLWKDGPKFAEYNVGVTDGKAESYGGYYAWGGSQDKVDDHNTSNTGTGDLTGTDDTATKLWGSKWRMPTQTELQGLIDNCDVAWTTVNDKTGRKFTGKGAYASNSVFLPAAGFCGSGGFNGQGIGGSYWSSTPCGSYNAYILDFYSGGQSVGNDSRSLGYSVRAVLAE